MIGDIHGQFYDMVEMLDEITPRLDKEPDLHLVFMGDYVDRGIRCVEVLAYLLALKLNHPKRIIMLRGNHESRSMTEHFTFRKECIDKFDLETYEAFIGLFDCLPLAASANGLYLCVHGGISPDLTRVSDINDRVDRFKEPPNVGLFCDLLWSDPIYDEAEARELDFAKNVERDCSFRYGLRPLKNLLRGDRMLMLVRAHEVQPDGFNAHLWEGHDQFPLVMTVFSAPNYCGSYQNRAAIAISKVDEMENLSIKQFDPAKNLQRPYSLPNGLDAFSWSAPFLCDCVTKMFFNLLAHSKYVDEEDTKQIEKESAAEAAKKISQAFGAAKLKRMHTEAVRHKIRAVGRLGRIWGIRKNN